jgi:hypothetical protein
VLGDLRDDLGPLGAIVGIERFDRPYCVVLILGVVDLRERGFRTWVRRLRQGSKNIRADVERAPLSRVSGNTSRKAFHSPSARSPTASGNIAMAAAET